jgi:Leucine-rich repeat (LRR) protein
MMFPKIQRKMILIVVMVMMACVLPASAGAATAPEVNCAGVTQIPLAECQALEALYTSTNGAQWYDRAGWTTTNTPCSWYGVTCQAGRVAELDLRDNNLAGPLPAQLGNLTQLRVLSLKRNALTGPLPSGLASMTQLQTLDLSENQLSGAVPGQLGSLAALQVLNLSNNQLSAGIPTQLAGLAALRTLDLSTNQLTGEIPGALGGLASLQVLGLNNNQLSGVIPAQLANLSNLRLLLLANNNLTGTIPTGLSGLSNLTHLVLTRNQLSGQIPEQLGSLSQLSVLMLNNNRLTGSIPASLGNLGNAFEIWLNSNALSGAVPANLCDLQGLFFLDTAFNTLTSAPACMAFLDPEWDQTQTVAPMALFAAPGDVQVSLGWTPILYHSNDGHYEISYRPAGGTFMVHGVTASKNVSSYMVTGLTPETNYEFRVRTYTAAHMEPPAYQQNALWSGYAVVNVRTLPAGGAITRSIFLPIVTKR